MISLIALPSHALSNASFCAIISSLYWNPPFHLTILISMESFHNLSSSLLHFYHSSLEKWRRKTSLTVQLLRSFKANTNHCQIWQYSRKVVNLSRLRGWSTDSGKLWIFRLPIYKYPSYCVKICIVLQNYEIFVWLIFAVDLRHLLEGIPFNNVVHYWTDFSWKGYRILVYSKLKVVNSPHKVSIHIKYF